MTSGLQGNEAVNPKKRYIASDDPVVQEVREVRARLWEEGGGTIEGLMRVVKAKAAIVFKTPERKRKAKS